MHRYWLLHHETNQSHESKVRLVAKMLQLKTVRTSLLAASECSWVNACSLSSLIERKTELKKLYSNSHGILPSALANSIQQLKEVLLWSNGHVLNFIFQFINFTFFNKLHHTTRKLNFPKIQKFKNLRKLLIRIQKALIQRSGSISFHHPQDFSTIYQ